MAEDRGTVSRVAWRELFPWLLILRSYRIAISPPVLLLAALGTLLTPLGWELAAGIVGSPRDSAPTILALPGTDFPGLAGHDPADAHWSDVPRQVLRTNVVGVYWLFVQPLVELVDRANSLRTVAFYACVGFWNVLVWAFFAGAITRIAVVQLGREERIGLGESLRHAGKHYLWNVSAPLFPLLGVVLCGTPIALLGLAMRSDVGLLVAGLLWVFAVSAGLVIAILLLGLGFGWPLMWPAISSEETGDAFEAFSRSYSFTLNRPLNYFLYALLAVAFGALCWGAVWAVASVTVEATYWAASWGAGGERIARLTTGPPADSGLLWIGTALIQLIVLLVRVIATGFNHAFFWCAASAIYLCLRRDVDQTEFDEVFVEDEDSRFQLPSLKVGEAAVTGLGAAPAGDAVAESPNQPPASA